MRIEQQHKSISLEHDKKAIQAVIDKLIYCRDTISEYIERYSISDQEIDDKIDLLSKKINQLANFIVELDNLKKN